MPRSAKAQASRRSSPRSIGQRDPSLRWPHLYDILRSKGYSKEKSARISNSRLRYRKKGRLQGLPYKLADSKGALRGVARGQKKGRTASSLVAACHSAACAPPPIGTGGSSDGGRLSIASMAKAATMRGASGGGGGDAAVRAKTRVIGTEGARGDSEAVDLETFYAYAKKGHEQLDQMRANASSIDGLKDPENWDKLKSDTWNEVQTEWGGATIDAHTGVALPQGENKWALTVKDPGIDTLSIPIDSSESTFRTAMTVARDKFGSILEREGHHLGVFRDDDVGRIDFDPVIVVSDVSDVRTIGAASYAIGGAYNFADGNGYWPPHVKD